MITRRTAYDNFTFALLDASGDPVTGADVTAQISKNGGALAALTNAVVEIGSGLYKVRLTALETDADEFTLVFTDDGATGLQVTERITPQPFSATSRVRYPVQQNRTLFGYTFFLQDVSGEPVTGAGAAVDAKISKDGGALADIAGAVSEIGDGLYKVDLTAGETNAAILTLWFRDEATNAIPTVHHVPTLLESKFERARFANLRKPGARSDGR